MTKEEMVYWINELLTRVSSSDPMWYYEAVKELESEVPEPNEEWRKEHYKRAYNQGFVDGCKSYEKAMERREKDE